jgi:hypothetical protein
MEQIEETVMKKEREEKRAKLRAKIRAAEKRKIHADDVKHDSERSETPKEKDAEFLDGKDVRILDQTIICGHDLWPVADALLELHLTGRVHKKMDEKRKVFRIICANLLDSRGDYAIRVSFGRNNYGRKGRFANLGYFGWEVLRWMLDEDYIWRSKWYQSKWESRIIPTEKFLTCFKGEPVRLETLRRVRKIDLRDKNKKSIRFTPTKETERIKKIIDLANKVNKKALIQVGSGRKMKTLFFKFHTVPNVDLEHGGRLYEVGRGCQHLHREDRQDITINGEHVVEVDFRAFHPRLLYTLIEKQYPLDSDPYDIGLDDDLRPLVKEVFLAIINAENETKAVGVGNQFIGKHGMKEEMDEKGLKVKRDLIPAIKKTHPAISQYFCTGAGLRLQNLDSKIALQVIESFVDDGIPILCEHDSFLVQEQYSARLDLAMRRAYKQVTGFRCPVSEKGSNRTSNT